METAITLTHAFVWTAVALAAFAGILALRWDSLCAGPWLRASLCEARDLSAEELAEIELTRWTLAEKYRQRAQSAKETRQAAQVAAFEAAASLPFYRPTWEVSEVLASARQSALGTALGVQQAWERFRARVALENMRTATLGRLLNLPGVGPVRARKIIDLGRTLSVPDLTRILGRPVTACALQRA